LPESELLKNLTDVVFLATPAEVSLRLAPLILEAGKKVIDISGAFRLKKNDYSTWYGFDHHEKNWLNKAYYGLVPFSASTNSLSQSSSAQAQLIANPGCYATAISMALIPLLKDNVIDKNHIVVDAKSGTSGAGKKASENMLFTEVAGECLPYKVGRHQHFPEIVEAVENLAGQKIDFHLTTSLLPVRRGIIAGVYAHMQQGKTLADVQKAYVSAYSEYPLVSHGTVEAQAKNQNALLSLKKVIGTARTHISYELVNDKLFIFSTIDNLLKGAASQAIENMNNLFGLNSIVGLDQLEAIT